MNNQINDGGPAIPLAWNGNQSHRGVSIRDYFAAAALQGLLSRIPPNQMWSVEDAAITCHRMADAMLKAREAKP